MVNLPSNADPFVFSAANRIDFSYLELPKVFEDVDFTSILNDAITKVEDAERAAGREPGQILESHTFAKLLEAVAYMKELLLHRVNEAAQAVLVSHSTGTDLEALGAFYGVVRQLLEPLPEDPNATPVFESDTELRRRIALAPERLSLAATESSYVFFGLSANDKPTNVTVEKATANEVVVRYTFDHSYLAASIIDASATSPDPGRVVVTLMDRSAGRVPPADVIREMQFRINEPFAKPLTDEVSVQPVKPLPFEVKAVLYIYPGVDANRVLADSRARLDAFLKRQSYIGRDITRDGLTGAMMGLNIHSIDLVSPAADIIVSPYEVGLCSAISVTRGSDNV